MRLQPLSTDNEATTQMRRCQERRQIRLGRRVTDDQKRRRRDLRQLPGENLEARGVVP